MTPLFYAAGMLALMALGACSEERHPLDRHLGQLRPETVAALPDMGWPPGTLLCPLTMYQSELPGSAPPADRVNAFLKQKQFLGDEGLWSLIVVKPMPEGDAGIEQLLFKRADYDVFNEPEMLKREGGTLPTGFVPQTCVSVERARVLVTRPQRSDRTLIVFGAA
ncbi:hypothetical protein IGS61_09820 [Janthinobacterium sp. FW305-129]|uniref:hypothetical protein n=1 Tax=Janthinobacterium sp. FW305-129 TaxID=2775054 RepID=UPI001E453721|nr:hypothetical protein [Janthinobacterium sp. FW305-129]MCC7597783.1 hypothetical protein [Janthinobacterium sp. FW305-129]